MSALTDSEDSDEMPHDVAFHEGIHCLLFREQNTVLFGNYNLCASIFSMGHSKLILYQPRR